METQEKIGTVFMKPLEALKKICEENPINRVIGVFLPKYEKYGRAAPLKRNITIIEYADLVLAFWDGASHGTKFVIDRCKRFNVPIRVFISTKHI